MTKRLNYQADKLRRKMAVNRRATSYDHAETAHALDWSVENARRQVCLEADKLLQAMEGTGFTMFDGLRRAVKRLHELEHDRDP